jgi:hypothetical protein
VARRIPPRRQITRAHIKHEACEAGRGQASRGAAILALSYNHWGSPTSRSHLLASRCFRLTGATRLLRPPVLFRTAAFCGKPGFSYTQTRALQLSPYPPTATPRVSNIPRPSYAHPRSSRYPLPSQRPPGEPQGLTPLLLHPQMCSRVSPGCVFLPRPPQPMRFKVSPPRVPPPSAPSSQASLSFLCPRRVPPLSNPASLFPLTPIPSAPDTRPPARSGRPPRACTPAP